MEYIKYPTDAVASTFLIYKKISSSTQLSVLVVVFIIFVYLILITAFSFFFLFYSFYFITIVNKVLFYYSNKCFMKFIKKSLEKL